MNAKLILKNFGPVKEVNIELKKFNVFIGPQGSGKSSIAKVLSLIHSFDYTISHVSDDKKN